MTARANKITVVNAGGPPRSRMRTRWTARIAQFQRLPARLPANVRVSRRLSCTSGGDSPPLQVRDAGRPSDPAAPTVGRH